MAQLVAHHTGSVGVRGSSPLSSTRKPQVKGLNRQDLAATSRLPQDFFANRLGVGESTVPRPIGDNEGAP
jgi:hypothetical protein